jgi:hypothetical protein
MSDIQFDDFGEIRVETTPKPDALQKALRGVIGPAGSPLADPRWMEVGAYDERRRILQQLELFNHAGPFAGSAHEYIQFADGSWTRTADFREEMQRRAYQMLRAGESIEAAAIACYLTTDEARQIAERHGINPTHL